MENEDQFIRSLLSNNSTKMAPAGFTDTVMRQVETLERRRIYRRLVLTIVLRTAVFTGLLLLLVVPWAIRGFRLDGLVSFLEGEGHGVVNSLKNAYYLVPLVVLLIGRKVFATK